MKHLTLRPAHAKGWLVWAAIAIAYFFIGISLSSGLFEHQIIAGVLSVAIAALVVWVCYGGLAKQIKATSPQSNALSESVSQPVFQPLTPLTTRVELHMGDAERPRDDQEENLTFEQLESPIWTNQTQALDAARSAVFLRSLAPYPGWTFAADWDNPDSSFRLRRRIWEYFNEQKLEIPFVFEWYGGLRLNLFLGNDLSRQLFIAGCTEPNEFAFLEELLLPGMIFIDAGANDGLFTLFASRRVGPEGTVWAFEPSEREFARLEQNLTLNQLQNVRAFPVALAERDGEEDLAVAGYEHEGQNTLGAFAYEGVKLARTERITIRKLDKLVLEEKLSTINVMKLDVEGAEHRVLEGCREVLTRFRPVVLFEVFDAALQKQGSSRHKLLELFRSLSYKLFIFDTSGQPSPASSGDFSDNMIAIPAEGPAVRKPLTPCGPRS